MMFVAIFELERAYGGPEEGGWWYDTGELKRTVATFPDEDQADEYSRRFNRTLAYRRKKKIGGWWEGHYRAPLSSVAYSGGHYEAQVWKERPYSYPEHRPQYE